MNITGGNVLKRDDVDISLQSQGPDSIGIVLIIGSLLFLAMHAIGPHPVPFIAPGDLFENEPKVVATSLSASVAWIGMLIVALTFPLCQQYFKEFMCVPFIIVILCQIVPFYLYFPETKGMPNSVISSMFQIDKPWRHAIGLRRTELNTSTLLFNNSKQSLHNSSIEILSIKTISSANLD